MRWVVCERELQELRSKATSGLRVKELRQAFNKKGICIHLRPRNYALL
jgi:hypothetical protein